MGFIGERSPIHAISRIIKSSTITDFLNKIGLPLSKNDDENQCIIESLIHSKNELSPLESSTKYVISIDGSFYPEKLTHGFPGASYGCLAIAAVFIDIDRQVALSKESDIFPHQWKETMDTTTIDIGIIGSNCLYEDENNSLDSFRKNLFDVFSVTKFCADGETLLETYEALLKYRLEKGSAGSAVSPTSGKKMIYGNGCFLCPDTNKKLYSTDALRLHELTGSGGDSIQVYSQIMSLLEKLVLVNVLRYIEQKNSMNILKEITFILDGPLAVFGHSSWISDSIFNELKRINDKQKLLNHIDITIFGIEKSGPFFNHLKQLDTSYHGKFGKLDNGTIMLLNDEYIKRNIQFDVDVAHPNRKTYGKDTYFGRKFFYKNSNGHLFVPVVASYSLKQKNIKSAELHDYPKIAEVICLLDNFYSCRYENAFSPLIYSHAHAAINSSQAKKFFNPISNKIRNFKNLNEDNIKRA